MLYRFKRYLEQRNHENVLIHIGKCGGSSLRSAMKESTKLEITHAVHVTKPLYIKNQNYYIVARDPISRCISAFNWRYKLVVVDQTQKNRFDGEFEILKKYQNINNLAESLIDDSGKVNPEVAADFETIHHLRERISFYLEDFLKKCPTSMIKGVLMQESLNADIEHYLGVNNDNKPIEKLNRTTVPSELSPLGKANLVKYIQEDYHCLFKLSQLGHIRNDTMLKIFDNALT